MAWRPPPQHSDASGAGNRLMQQFEPLHLKLIGKNHQPGSASSRSCEALRKTGCDRVSVHEGHDNGDLGVCHPDSRNGNIGGRNYEIGALSRDLAREALHAIRGAGPTVDDQVPPLDEALVGKLGQYDATNGAERALTRASDWKLDS